MTLCACGCGQPVLRDGKRFLHGHNMRTTENRTAAKERLHRRMRLLHKQRSQTRRRQYHWARKAAKLLSIKDAR